MNDMVEVSRLQPVLDAIRTSPKSAKVCSAFVKAQSAIQPVKTDAENDHFGNGYATLRAVWNAARLVLVANGLAVIQGVSDAPGGVNITNRLIHESGEWIEAGPAFFPAAKLNAQGYGSAVTYGKRYTLCALLGIVIDDDDDGEAARRSSQRKDDERKTTTTSQPTERKSNLKPYPDDRLKEKLAGWKKEVGEGGDPAKIITFLKTKYTLTAAQEKQIRELDPANINEDR